jgi:NADH-quinone oxidoreductase subunit N
MSWSEVWLIMPMVWLALGGLVVLVVDAAVRREGHGHLLLTSLLFLGLAAGSTLSRLGTGETVAVFAGALRADSFANFFNLVFVAVATLSLLTGSAYFGRTRHPAPEFYPLVLFATVGMMVLTAATDLVTLFVGLETMSIALYVLAAIQRRSIFSNEAGFKYLILGAFSSAFLLYGMALLYGSTRTLNLELMVATVQADAAIAQSMLFMAGWGLLLVGLGFKVAMVPFHMWTPDVYDGSPAPVAGFMAAGVKAASFAALLRVAWSGAPAFLDIWGPAIAALAIVTMVFGNIVALAQTNLKRLLAYSAIAHAGYLLVGVLASRPETDDAAASGVLFYLLAYGLMNVGAFALVSLVSRREGESAELSGFGGLARRNPVASAAMAVCLLSLAGIPPTAGFWGKLYIFEAAMENGYVGLAVVALLNSAVAMFYYLRVIVAMYMKEPTSEPYEGESVQIGLAMALVAVLILWIGIAPGPVAELARQGTAALAASF